MLTFEAALQYLEDKTDTLKIQYLSNPDKAGVWSVYACACNEHLDFEGCKFKIEVIQDWSTEEDDITTALHKIIISTHEAFRAEEEKLPVLEN